MERYLIGIMAAALVITWQSSCLKFEGGMLVNKCGIYQKLTGQPMYITLGKIPERVEVIHTPPEVVKEIVKVPVYTPPAPPTREQIESGGYKPVGNFDPKTWGQRGLISCKNGKLLTVRNIDWDNAPRALDPAVLEQFCKPKPTATLVQDTTGNGNYISSGVGVVIISAPYVLTIGDCGKEVVSQPNTPAGVLTRVTVPPNFSCLEKHSAAESDKEQLAQNRAQVLTTGSGGHSITTTPTAGTMFYSNNMQYQFNDAHNSVVQFNDTHSNNVVQFNVSHDGGCYSDYYDGTAGRGSCASTSSLGGAVMCQGEHGNYWIQTGDICR